MARDAQAVGAIPRELRPRRRTCRDERGRDVFDLPDAPMPGLDAPAPPRFLPEHDNILLSHDDRSRFMAKADRPFLFAGDGPVLIDGFLRGTWVLASTTLTIRHRPLDATEELEAPGLQLLRFLVPEADAYDVRLIAAT